MRSKTTKKDLPSTHDVTVYIHNSFTDKIKLLNEENNSEYDTFFLKKTTHKFWQAAPGKISTTSDGWTADNTKGSFLGMTAHWIEVKDGKWTLRSEVIGFQPISGEHSGRNLGRYFVSLCDRVGTAWGL